jgi:hypothetical protein
MAYSKEIASEPENIAFTLISGYSLTQTFWGTTTAVPLFLY